MDLDAELSTSSSSSLPTPIPCWEPLVVALSTIPTLEHYEFAHCMVCGRHQGQNVHPTTGETTSRWSSSSIGSFSLTPSQTTRCDFYPRLNMAGYPSLLSSSSSSSCGATVTQWVDTLCHVHDRIDCIHHVICSNPALFANAALLGT